MKVTLEKHAREWGPIQEWAAALKSKENNALECMETECKGLYRVEGVDGGKYQLHGVEDLRPLVCEIGGYGVNVWFTVTRWIRCRISCYERWEASREAVLRIEYYGAQRSGSNWTWYAWDECDDTGTPCGKAVRVTPYIQLPL